MRQPAAQRPRVDEAFFVAQRRTQAALEGEVLLVGAILKRAVDDVLHPAPAPLKMSSNVTVDEQLSAIEFLVSADHVGYFAGLLQLDDSWLQEQLLAAAGLSQAQPRLGERREPVPNELQRKLYSPEPATPTGRRLVNPGDFVKKPSKKRKRPRHAQHATPHDS